MKLNAFGILTSILFLPIICNAQQGNEVTFNSDKGIIVIDPKGDTLKGDSQYIIPNSGVYKSSLNFKNGIIVMKLDSTKASKMLGTKFKFDLKSVAESNGVQFNAEYPTIVNLWSTTCKSCIEEFPILNKLLKEHPNFNYLAITNVPDSAVKHLLGKNPFDYNIISGKSDIISYYKDMGFPLHFLIDQNMMIKKLITRWLTEKDKMLIDWFYVIPN